MASKSIAIIQVALASLKKVAFYMRLKAVQELLSQNNLVEPYRIGTCLGKSRAS